MSQQTTSSSRRQFLKLGVTAGMLSVAPLSLSAQTLNTTAHVVIMGVGAAGTAMANRLRKRLTGNKITLIGARKEHLYQPGYTMIASGLWAPERVVSQTQDWLPNGVDWVAQDVKAVNGETKSVTLEDGTTLSFDVLVVATGCQLNYDQIEGLTPDMIGSNGIGSVYAGPQGALKTSQQIDAWLDSGQGRGIFTLPNTFLKCAGAPLKMTFTTLSRVEKRPEPNAFKVEFFTPYKDRVFSVPLYNQFVVERWQQQGVDLHYSRILKAMDVAAKKAYFQQEDGSLVEEAYDFIHVVPPMSAPTAILESDLVWQEGPFANNWLEVDQFTLQHRRFPNIFGIGDVIGVPLGKTAASVKLQAPVIEANLMAFLKGDELKASYNGYTSCPLITGIGKAILAEFGYNNVLLPSFSFIDPTEESWAVWVMEEQMLQPAYNAMLSGRV
ncbi:NAD(P)/FAD-dependent oxidoreductase [Vibrio cholerae]|nr:NAD(P)/FAD-dependent oxidoreductase [Vibrio cholerae]